MNAFSIGSIGRSGRLMALAMALALGGTAGGALIVPGCQAASAAVVSVTVRQQLSNYGAWQTSRRYGDVWVPSVAAQWRPYTDGRWIWTDDGWYWQSNEPFGAVVYHYGNWVYDDDLGWVWIAGDEWAPAWVVWRESADDIGWAPAPPPQVRVVADTWWAFAPVAALGAVNILQEVRPVEQNVTIVRNTTVINNTTIVNNYGGNRRVHLGNMVVPVNAGPPLARLPKPVFAAVKAAKIAPPAKGKIVEAHLDATKGAAIKQMAMRQQPPANAAAAGKPAPAGQALLKPAVGKQQPPNAQKPPAANLAKSGKTPAGNPALASKPAVAAAAKPAHTGKPPAAVAMSKKPLPKQVQSAEARSSMAKAEAAKRAENARAAAAAHPAPKRPPASPQVAKLNKPKPEARKEKQPASAKRAPEKCDPHDPRCKHQG